MEASSIALKTIPLEYTAVIRPLTEEDLPKLEWFGQYWHFRKIFERTYQDQLQGRRLMLIADVNNFPIAQLFIQFHSLEFHFADGQQRAYVYSLRVMAPFQNQGLGSQLMTVAEETIRARGFSWVTIAVAKTNEGALRLYNRLGYKKFRDDPGKWSYVDPAGKRRSVDEPSWVLEKQLT